MDELESDTAWFLLDVSRAIKPFIFQDREKAKMVSQTNLDSDDVFMRGEFKFGCESRGAAGFGPWQLCYGSDGTT